MSTCLIYPLPPELTLPYPHHMGVQGDDGDEEQAILAAIHARSETFDELAERINRFPDPQRAFELATLLADAERKLGGPAADLRAQQVRRIWEAEELTLTELGNRIGGVSKQRARRLLLDAGAKNAPPVEAEEGRTNE